MTITRMLIHPASLIEAAVDLIATDMREIQRKAGGTCAAELHSLKNTQETLRMVIREEWPDWAAQYLDKSED